MDDPSKTPFECIDRPVGDQIWRLEQMEIEPWKRAELEAHLSACHACRLLVRLDAKARELGRSGRLDRPAAVSRPRDRLRLRSPAIWAGGLVLAASLAGVLLLPPRPATDELSLRGRASFQFLRPVEGDVVVATRPVLRWTPVPGASRYLVELRDQDGRSLWTGESPVPAVRPPDGISLARGSSYKATVSAQPADVAPAGGASVVFRCDSIWRLTLHRIRWAHPVLQTSSLVALALLVFLGIRRRI